MLLSVVMVIINMVFVMLAIAFYTLFERKILSLSQIRVGPNKVVLMGVLQPVFDGIKLIFKEMPLTDKTKKWNLFLFPIFMFSMMMVLWVIVPSSWIFNVFSFEFFILLLFLGLMVFFIMLLAILSKSKYASLGSMRSASQSISYEISLSFIIFSPFILVHSLVFYKFYSSSVTLSVLVFLLWWTTCLMECNRAPFDFAEGESELISGFNVEYSSLGFVFIFLGEYGMMLLFSILTSIMFFNSLTMFVLLFMSMIVARTSYPRFRYDLLMEMCWLMILPFSIMFMFCLLFV